MWRQGRSLPLQTPPAVGAAGPGDRGGFPHAADSPTSIPCRGTAVHHAAAGAVAIAAAAAAAAIAGAAATANAVAAAANAVAAANGLAATKCSCPADV